MSKIRVMIRTMMISLALFLGTTNVSRAEGGTPKRIGFAGSLSGFAAQYGTAALDGARLAVEELSKNGPPPLLFVEDDQSSPKNLATAYQKLRNVDRIDALITASWWANGIVKTVERDGIPFISCETLFNREYVRAPNYFSLLGDLREWVRVYEPLVAERGWKRASMVKFVSGFADTLRDEMEALFSKDGRAFAPAIEYADFEMEQAPSIALHVKTMAPEVVYIDGQPSSFGKLMTKLIEQKTSGVTIFSNSIARDAIDGRLFDAASFRGEIYFTSRETFRPRFVDAFRRKYDRPPTLNADLGYYAVRLLDQAMAGSDSPVDALRSGKLTVDELRFVFDENNIYGGMKQEVFVFREGKIDAVGGSGSSSRAVRGEP